MPVLACVEDYEEPQRRYLGLKYGQRCSVVMDGRSIRLQRDVSAIATEVIHHFTSLVDAEVEVILEISVKARDEIPEQVVRTVSENCKTLKFRSSEFETE